MTIVAGTDFSEYAAEAVTVAAHMALRLSARLELVHCFDGPAHEAQEALRREAEARLTGEAQRVRALGVDVGIRSVPGDPASALIDCAARLDASFIAVGAHGQGRAGGARIGSRADLLAARSHVPVLVVHDPKPFLAWIAGERSLHVLLGADASSTTVAALRFVDTLREVGPCTLHALHLFWPPEQFERLGFGGARSFVDVDPEVRSAISEGLAEYLGSVPVEVAPRLGNLGEGLAGASTRAGADLIVVGTHGRDALGRLWEGSVSRGVLHSSETSVACVPLASAAPIAVRPMSSALVATDFSDIGNAGVPLGYAVVQEGGTVHLIHVVPAREVGVLEPTEIFALERSAAPSAVRERTHEKLRALIPRTDIAHARSTEVHVVESNHPEQAIAQAAERLHVDVICLGTSGRTGVVKALLGSVTQGVIEHTTRPVLLTRTAR